MMMERTIQNYNEGDYDPQMPGVLFEQVKFLDIRGGLCNDSACITPQPHQHHIKEDSSSADVAQDSDVLMPQKDNEKPSIGKGLPLNPLPIDDFFYDIEGVFK